MTIKYFVCLFLLSFSIAIHSPGHAITTIPTTADEEIVWSIDGISDSKIQLISHTQNPEIFYYRAPLRMGAVTTVRVNIPDPDDFSDDGYGQRLLQISTPDAGTRWVAQKEWSSNTDGWPAPTTVSMAHQVKYTPYQRDPVYPDSGFQADKHIFIRDWTFSYTIEGPSIFTDVYIFVVPELLIGMSNSEENGLPLHAKTEPDYKTKKPYGCNGCSEMGLPGYRVNMANLLPVVQDTLFQWGGLGPAVSLALTWNAKQEASPTDFGNGWHFSYDAWLNEGSNGVTIQQDTGGQLHFNIPPTYNGWVTSIASVVNNEQVIYLEEGEGLQPMPVPEYTIDWDGKFSPDRSGYHLDKSLGGDPSIRTFTLSPPNQKLSYIFQGPSGTSDLVPLIAIEDWNGNRVDITRNATGAITQITDAVGRFATLTYNSQGQCTTLTIPGGQQLTFSYSGPNLIRSVDLISNQTDYTYNSDNYITGMNTEGRLWQFDWTTTSNVDHLSSVTDPNGEQTKYAIGVQDLVGRSTRITDATGRVFTYYYPNGQYESNTRQQAPRVVHDSTGRPIEVYRQSTYSNPRTLEYDDDGNLIRLIEFDHGIHNWTYNDTGQVTQYLDALNNIWLTEYDSNGNIVRSETPAGRVQQNEYNINGQLTQSIDPMGNVSRWTYDSFGNVQTSTDAEGTTTTFAYDDNGFDLTSITNSLGQQTSFSYDTNRRLLRTTHPDGTYREILYDCCAAIGVRNENGDIRTISRSPSLKVLTESDYLGNIVTKTYDTVGRQLTSTDPLGRTTTTAYNTLGQVSSMQNALGGTVNWNYTADKSLTSHTLSQEPLAQIDINTNQWGIPSEANKVQIRRDTMRRLSTIIPRNRDQWEPLDYSRLINFSHDTDGLLTGKSTSTTSIASFAYDSNGYLATSTHPLGIDSYLRNGRNQVTRQTWRSLHTADFSYDDVGRLSSLTYPGGYVAAYTYNSRGRIANITWNGHTLQTQYDGVGNITREDRSNGVDTDITSDKNSKPIRIHHHIATNTLFDLQCSRNGNGLLASCTKSGDAVNWSPVLTAENTSTQYKYDRSYTIDTINGQAASTDITGNQSHIPGSRNFNGSYDVQDLLTNWTTNSSDNSAVYDGQDRLVQWSRGALTRNFHYDEHDRLLFETDGRNNVTAMWLYRGYQIVAMMNPNVIYFYHNDLSGNVSFLSDGSGKIAAAYSYLPFGLQTASMSTVQNPFTFVGSLGVLDLGEGLYYMRSRTYDAKSHAFLSNDPIGMGVTPNAREYANNNPINWIDPDGRSSCQYQTYDASTNPMGNWGYVPPQPKTSDSCVMDTIINVAGTDKIYGSTVGALQIANKLRQGKVGEAVYDAVPLAVGLGKSMASKVAGVFPMFMQANRCGEEDDAAEAASMQKFKDNPNSYYNKHVKKAPSFGDFIIEPFTLDD